LSTKFPAGMTFSLASLMLSAGTAMLMQSF
jgi:hypothetical protein